MGAYGALQGGQQPLILHWNGTQWQQNLNLTFDPTSRGTHLLQDIAVITPNDVWAVGENQVSDTDRHALIFHWDGTTWQQVLAAGTTSGLTSVRQLAQNAVWAVGADGLILHWDGHRWHVVNNEYTGNFHDYFSGVAASANSNIWVGGQVSGEWPFVMNWDGTTWHLLHTPWDAPTALLNPRGNITGIATLPNSGIWLAGGEVASSNEADPKIPLHAFAASFIPGSCP